MLERLRADDDSRPVYVFGRPDTGKSWLTRRLLEDLSGTYPSALLDADPGQSSFGLPGTLALTPVSGLTGPGEPGEGRGQPLLRFIGALSPAGNMLRMLSGLSVLGREAGRRGCRKLLVDSSGFVSGRPGREFQAACIDALDPGVLIVTGSLREHLPFLPLFSGGGRREVLSVDLGQKPAGKSPGFRKAYRTAAFRRYFAAASDRELSLSGLPVFGVDLSAETAGSWVGRICGLIDREGFVIAVGVAVRFDPERLMLRLFLPPVELPAGITLVAGNFHLSPGEVGGGTIHDGGC